jgi:hypothetical protein
MPETGGVTTESADREPTDPAVPSTQISPCAVFVAPVSNSRLTMNLRGQQVIQALAPSGQVAF